MFNIIKFLKRLKNESWIVGFGHLPKNQRLESLTATWKPKGDKIEPPTNIISLPEIDKKFSVSAKDLSDAVKCASSKSPQNNRPLKHRKALLVLYKKYGVGRTVNQRFNFWHSFNTTLPVFSKEPTNAGEVVFLEEEWLISQFPADFDYH